MSTDRNSTSTEATPKGVSVGAESSIGDTGPKEFGDQTVREVRAHLPEVSKTRSSLTGVTLFAVSLLLYVLTFAATILLPGWPLKIVAGLANGFFVAVLFVIAHDACHQALTPSPILNRIIGRISFLPSLHPYTSWEHSHNGLHHAFTNVKKIDPGYAPYSLSEFLALPAWRRCLERGYRTTLGLGLLYLVEIWWRCELFPSQNRRPKQRNRTFQLDRILVAAFFISEILLLVFSAWRLHLNPFAMIGVGFFIPYLSWNFVSGFLTFQHHTHPKVPWYADVKEWTYFQGQVRSVVHVEFPFIVEIILHNIMQHTAHHVDPRIPLYHLRETQASLEAAYGAEITSVKFTWKGFFATIATCKLYDYEAHRWLDFDGTPTTPPLLSQNRLATAAPNGGAA
jgi:acyl-lipid omega-6 desaturase (Delta-12 desaturase)